VAYETVRLEHEGEVAVLTLNRPDRLNALTLEMLAEMEQALREVEEGPARVLVLTGAGRGFCAGADVSALARGSGTQAPDLMERARRPLGALALRLLAFPKPVLASINGVTAGAGLSLALLCDLRIASESARFTAVFVRRGLTPDYGCTWTLPRVVGLSNAFLLMYTGRVIGAQEALAMGLVSQVVPDDRLREETLGLAGEIARQAPIPQTFIRRLTWQGLTATLEQQLWQETYAQSVCRRTEDHREGVQAFLEKREPVFRGR